MKNKGNARNVTLWYLIPSMARKILTLNSVLLHDKYFYFIEKLVYYFFFFFVPIFLLKNYKLELFGQFFLLTLYIFFIYSQAYSLGKELDYRFNILYAKKSSVETALYRIFLGKGAFVLLFYLPTQYLSREYVNIFYWSFWPLLFLFFAWPTRMKVLKGIFQLGFRDFRVMDFIEKVTVFAIIVYGIVSLPFPVVDSHRVMGQLQDQVLFQSFFAPLFGPFYGMENIYPQSIMFFIYCSGLFILLTSGYCFFRHFFSRRLALLGIFSTVASWSFVKYINHDFFALYRSGLAILWIWVIFWLFNSRTFRSGLFLGFITLWSALVNINYLVFYPLTIIYYLFQKRHHNHPVWFQINFTKYFLPFIFIILALLFRQGLTWQFENIDIINQIIYFIDLKAFFILALFGLGIVLINFKKYLKPYKNFWIFIGVIFLYSLWGSAPIVHGLSLMIFLSFMALFLVDWVGHQVHPFRSKKNIVFTIYFLIILLDSHLEGRVKNMIEILSDNF